MIDLLTLSREQSMRLLDWPAHIFAGFTDYQLACAVHNRHVRWKLDMKDDTISNQAVGDVVNGD